MNVMQSLRRSINHTLGTIYRNWGETFAERYDNAHAVTLCTRAIRLNPEDGEAYLHRGVAYFQARQYTPALTDFQAALHHVHATYLKIDAYLWQGLAYYYLGEAEAAISNFNMALYLDPSHSMAYVYRGAAEMGRDNVTGALTDFNSAIHCEADNHIAYRHRAEAREQLGQYRAALQDYRQYLYNASDHNAHQAANVQAHIHLLEQRLRTAA